MTKVIFNGQVINESEAKVFVFDKAYFFDFAVYSSLKVIKGKIFFADYHADRLLESARIIDLGHGFNKAQIVAWLELAVTENNLADGLLKVVLIGDADNNTDAKLYITPIAGVTFYPDKLYKHGAKVITYRGERQLPTSKVKDLLLGFLAYREAKKVDALDALLIDHDGNIREGTRTNFFAIKGNTLITPPTAVVLEGITKKIIMEIAADDFEIREENIPADKLADYEEFFITSTSMNVMPVSQIDDLVIKTDFCQTKIVAKLFKEYYRKNILT